jgi:hypothetical protein
MSFNDTKVIDALTGEQPDIKVTITQTKEGMLLKVDPPGIPGQAVGLMLINGIICTAARDGGSPHQVAAWLRQSAKIIGKMGEAVWRGYQGRGDVAH